MSGTNLIDDYLADLMDDPPPRKPDPAVAAAAGPQETPPVQEPPAQAPDVDEPPAGQPPVEEPPAEDAPAPTPPADEPPLEQDPDVPPTPGSGPTGDGPLESDPDVAAQAAGDADPLAAFREGGKHISDDEFEAMLDVLQGTAAPPAPAAPAAAPAPEAAADADPLAAFRTGGALIADDEFEAMLDALQNAPPAPAAAPAPAAPAAPAPPPAAPELIRAPPPVAIDHMLAPQAPVASALVPDTPTAPERRRRAEERISAWLRFNLGPQCFGVEVLKVQEVLKVPSILPVRGTDTAMLGLMNLRGQIVPVMDLAIRLGFGAVEPNEASRVIVLEENGETLGALVAAVADVTNVSDSKIERISGTSSLVAADVVRGIARREGTLIILLDATRLLA